jgi:hypothetical protein
MIGFRFALRWLTFSLPVLVVTFAVLMGGVALAWLIGDLPAARLIGAFAAAVVMATVVDIILLVGLLAFAALRQDELRDETNGTLLTDQPSQPPDAKD